MIKCSKCNEYTEYKDRLIERKKINNHYLEIYRQDLVYGTKNKQYIFYSNIIDDINNGKLVDFKNIKLEIKEGIDYNCKHCHCDSQYYVRYSLANEFYGYATAYIWNELNEICIRHLGISLREAGQGHYINLESIINSLPRKYYKKKKILKYIFDHLQEIPKSGEKGGDSELIRWLLDQLATNTFTFVFTSAISGMFLLKKIINAKLKKKVIQRKIINNTASWNEISFEDLKEYFEIPTSYKGSKEQLIDEIISKKANEYKDYLIEKIRNKT